MGKQRKRFGAQFKSGVALEAIRAQRTINEIASEHGVHPNQVATWKKQALSALPEVFGSGKARVAKDGEKLTDRLYQEIGQLKVELDWLKKSLEAEAGVRRGWIGAKGTKLSIAKQCAITGFPRSTWYYEPAGESAMNLRLMRLIDEEYTRRPMYGEPKMTWVLREMGHEVNHKRVERLMRKMGLRALVPKRNLSKPREEARKYPYLLSGMKIERPNQVWSTDITYLRMMEGFLYLVAVMDWFSRYVISWELSNSLETGFCLEALERALKKGRPEIFNSDQGSQFTSLDYTGRLEKEGIRISMDGRGRCFDNIFVERLWRTVKYEEVYLKDYATGKEAAASLKAYFEFYNRERIHQALEYRTPHGVYHQN